MAESLRLKQDFLQSSIQFSLTIIELASTSTRNDKLSAACRHAAQQGYGRIRTMISQPAFAQLDLSELLPDFEPAGGSTRRHGRRHKLHREPPVPQQDVPPQPNEKLRTLILRGMEVLRHVADGQSTKEIAHQLGMSFKTAVCHRYRVMEKLGVHDAVSLTRFAVRAGLVKL